MSKPTQKTKRKFPRWILELFTFIFIPYLIVYISSPVIFGIILFIGIPVFIFLYFRLTNHIINSENPTGYKKLNIQQAPEAKEKSTKDQFLKRFYLAILALITVILIVFLLGNINSYRETMISLPDNFTFSTKSQELSKIHSLQNIIFMQMLGVIFLIFLTAWFFRKHIKLTLRNHILRVFVATVISGGILAFTIPSFLYNYRLIGETKDLTTALLGVTGGVVALFSLIKSHQKSELEREQLEVQKQKDSRDHIRQLYSTYGDRFDKAVTELNNNDRDANIAFAAVYKLSHLADDWLEFKNLATSEKDLSKFEDKANAEVQTIINVFCKYIRSMPHKYTDKMLESGDIPKEDAEIRRLILSEISDHLGEIIKHDNNIEIIPGPWSHFNFDFNNARIFYPLNNLIIKNSNFSDVVFHGEAKCNQTVFIDELNFSTVPFKSTADFSGATFMKKVYFGGLYNIDIFKNSAYFRKATFVETAHFRAQFSGNAYFEDANFKQEAKFESAVFKNSSYFTGATFEGNADFTDATFENTTTFNHATFIKDSIFSYATFIKDSTFIGVSFEKKVHFNACFKQFSPAFIMVPAGQPEIPNMRARFSLHSAQKDYDFSTYNGKTIPPGTAELDGVERSIPIGTVLFNPDIKNKKTGEYTRMSKPAK